MATVRGKLPLKPVLSVAVRAILYCPSAVGEPLNTPEELRLTPGGNPVADHVYGGVPPDAIKLVPAV